MIKIAYAKSTPDKFHPATWYRLLSNGEICVLTRTIVLKSQGKAESQKLVLPASYLQASLFPTRQIFNCKHQWLYSTYICVILYLPSCGSHFMRIDWGQVNEKQNKGTLNARTNARTHTWPHPSLQPSSPVSSALICRLFFVPVACWFKCVL